MNTISIYALWDEEASVWVAQSDDVAGLVTEAPSIPELQARIELLLPDLLAANDPERNFDAVPYRLLSELTAVAHRPL